MSQAIREALGLFASAIKSGESWSPTCERAYEAALAALASPAASPSVLRQAMEALELAVRQNQHDMLMTGEDCRRCEAALSAIRSELAANHSVDANKMVDSQQPDEWLKEAALMVNRLILMSAAKVRQADDPVYPEDRITDADIDALESKLLAHLADIKS